MNLVFEAALDPPPGLLSAIERFDPTNVFHTRAYAEARAAMGQRVCVLAQFEAGEPRAGCLGFVYGAHLRRRLEITSLATSPNPDSFWQGVWEFCRKAHVYQLLVETYGSRSSVLPSWPGEIRRRIRYEYLMDLGPGEEFLTALSSNHRRNVARARKANLTVRRTREAHACETHLQLMDASMNRRSKRGEAARRTTNSAFFEALLASGAGEIFQAADGETVVSSLLVLRSECGAYYQSAGTLPEGMRQGASPFLVVEAARRLQQDGVQLFNLGGAGPDAPGLQRFKAGFGARKVSLEAASFSVLSGIPRKLQTAGRFLRHGPSRLIGLFSRLEH